jgi:signal transduction histidine kinase
VTDHSAAPSRFGRLALPAAGSASGFANKRLDTVVESVRLVAVGALVWGMFASSHSGGKDHRIVFAVLVAVAAAAYVGWLVTRTLESDVVVVCLFGLAVAGGATVAFGSLGVVFLVILGMAAGAHLDIRSASAIVVTSVASLAVAILAVGASWELIGWATLGGVGGVMAGMNRREFQLRAVQSAQLLRERERTAVESAHAAALAERNRIAREIHDVLAHSLGALAVQLEAVDALLADGDVERAAAAVVTSRRLTVEGLDEARRAVHALRETPLALGDQLAALATSNSASFRMDGAERELPPDAGLALYRAAQEALTNARKHAPGAEVSVVLGFAPDRAFLSVVDGYPAGSGRGGRDVAGTGGGARDAAAVGGQARREAGADSPRSSTGDRHTGYGLTGMRERVELLGGSMTARATGDGAGGWLVEVEVPVHGNGNGHHNGSEPS